MRHNRKINHLSRTNTHRGAMLSNMASSLIKKKRIFTTVAKAKELRKYVEPLITKSRTDTTHSRRIVFKNLKDKYAVKELFLDISQKIGDRPGGYTRIIKTGNRLGDNAAMCMIELVDYNELLLKDKAPVKAVKTRRSRKRGGGSEAEDVQTAAPSTATEFVEIPEAEDVIETSVEEAQEEIPQAEVAEPVIETVETPNAVVEDAPQAETETTSESEPKQEA
jgi:large subunit ribosomal protein L17